MKAYVDASPTKLVVVLENGTQRMKDALETHTNNEAEYIAVMAALTWYPRVTEIYSDSQLVVNQLNGVYKVKEPRLTYLFSEVHRRANGKVKFTWVSREDNLAGKLLEKGKSNGR